MIVLRFEKYGTLWRYHGIPVYIGGKCITPRSICWWWPVNWLAVLSLIPLAIWRLVRKEVPRG